MRLGPCASIARVVLLTISLVAGTGCTREPAPEASPAPSPQAAACVPTIVVADWDGVVSYGNEFHRPSRLLIALCKADLALVTKERKKSLSWWLQTTQTEPAQGPGSTLRIYKEEPSPAPAEGLLVQARHHLPGLHDWCWVLGPTDL